MYLSAVEDKAKVICSRCRTGE